MANDAAEPDEIFENCGAQKLVRGFSNKVFV